MKTRAFLFVLWTASVAGAVRAADSPAGYQLPPKEVVDIIDARPEPSVSWSPDGKWMLLLERDAMPGIADVARRRLQLAGMRIDPIANGRFQLSYTRGLTLRSRMSPMS